MKRDGEEKGDKKEEKMMVREEEKEKPTQEVRMRRYETFPDSNNNYII